MNVYADIALLIGGVVVSAVAMYLALTWEACRIHMQVWGIDAPFLRSWWRFMLRRDIRTTRGG